MRSTRALIPLALAAALLGTASLAWGHTHSFDDGFKGKFRPETAAPFSKLRIHVYNLATNANPRCPRNRRVAIRQDGVLFRSGRTDSDGTVVFTGPFTAGHTYKAVISRKVLVDTAAHRHYCKRLSDAEKL